jgi:hypothetical protein
MYFGYISKGIKDKNILPRQFNRNVICNIFVTQSLLVRAQLSAVACQLETGTQFVAA